MPRSNPPLPDRKAPPTKPGAATQAVAAANARGEGYRDTVEAVVVAFILALLVRGFEAEAFVIPTGSMAPTLMGQHKEIDCPQCGYRYAVNASEESETYGGRAALRLVASGVCVNCRYQAKLIDEPTYKGDRILVMKFPYDMPFLPGASDPQRWDVVVFRYPEEPEVSYIKRLVGRPGETLKITRGDVFIRPANSAAFRQERRPLEHQRAMQMMVSDDAHRPVALRDRPEWRRWSPTAPGSWVEAATAPGTYDASPSGDTWSELRYRHLLPDPVQWKAIAEGEPPARGPRPTLITDFYSYNTNLNADNSDLDGHVTRDQESAWLQPDWVGDLTLSARVSAGAEPPAGSVRFELIEGGVSNRCEIDLATGEVVLRHGDTELGRARTASSWSKPHDVEFANVDDRLTLLVDGRGVFGDGVAYDDGPGPPPPPTADDLAPARVAAKGGKVRATGLVLKRDIYYTLTPGRPDYGNAWDARMPKNPVELFDLLADPGRVAEFMPLGAVEYPIREGHFLMLGDNSPRSKDSRGWETKDRLVAGYDETGEPAAGWDPSGRQAWEVPRGMLTGKAFCIYWPHGVPFRHNVRIWNDFRFPFRPQVERMKLIH